MPLFSQRFLMAAVCLALTACGTKQNASQSRNDVVAAEDISASFVVRTDKGKPGLVIRKSALEKEFLLQASLIPQTTVPMGNGLRSRIVVFKKRDGQLFLLEATPGHTVTNDMPQALVLTAFPIEKETDQEIAFDFNAGMSKIFLADGWTGHDITGKKYQPDFQSATVRHSYLEEVRIESKERLSLRQIASVIENKNTQVEVKYYLEPYRPDTTFVPSNSRPMKHTGFFELPPQLQLDGTSLVRSTKFHRAKPLTFTISANTPKEYKQAVRDGILYWNRAFGTNWITAIDGPAGVVAPDFNHHMIQWVPHDQAGFAYADALMDPRTGETLHAQVYLTSAFAFGGKARARSMLKRLRTAAPGNHEGHQHITLAGFHATPLCNYEPGQELQPALTQLIASNATDEQILRASQDYVRQVTAHEVGHVLGLRHNFAGSLTTKNYPLAERSKIFSKYLTVGAVPEGLSVSSSVMDYLPFEEDVLVGRQIALAKPALEYDAKAVSALYDGKQYKHGEIPWFCTDSQLTKFVDCQKFDAGNSLIEYAASTTEFAQRSVAYKIVERYIAAKAPAGNDEPEEVESISFDPKTIASEMYANRAKMVAAFSGAHFLPIFYSFPYVGELNKEEVKKKELEYIADELKKLGGLEVVFSTAKADYYTEVVDKVESLLLKEGYDKGVGLAGQPYSFSSSEILTIVEMTKKLITRLPEAILAADVALMRRIPTEWRGTNNPLGDELATVLAKKMEEYLMKTTGNLIEAEIEVPVFKREGETFAAGEAKTKMVKAQLPVFFYKYELRKDSADLLKASTSQDGLDWGVADRSALKAKFEKQLSDACGCNIVKTRLDDVKTKNADARRTVTRWFLENKKVLEEIK